MKKMILGLLLTAISGVAHAGLTVITDKAEVDAIKTATKIALAESKTVDCIYNNSKLNYPASDFQGFIDTSANVYRSDNGQPVLQFASDYGSQKIALSITTDSTGKKIASIHYLQQGLGSSKTVNLGTIANPNLQVVPAQWETMYNMTCTPK